MKLGLLKMAEKEGFEPSVSFPTHAFQACAFDHSAISPETSRQNREVKYMIIERSTR